MSLIRFEGALHNRLFNTITATLHEPLVTGSLLYILTLGPGHVRDRLLQPFRGNLLAKNGASRIATLIAILKAYFVLGIASRINKALNRLALNGWALKRQGSAFAFGPEKKELIVITGGSSGFGYEMVKAFSSAARVIAFDVNPLPAELNECRSSRQQKKSRWLHCDHHPWTATGANTTQCQACISITWTFQTPLDYKRCAPT